MTAPSYTTDLVDINTTEVIGTWVETGTWNAGAAPALEPDFFIQGANCIAKYMTSGGTGIGGFVMNFGGGITIPSPGAFFIWMMQQCPNNIDTEANGGLRAIIGSSNTAFNAWKLKGKDTYPYGGWICFPVDPAINGGTPDYTIGSPTSTKQWFGGAVNQLANAKGGTGIDVLRYGRGALQIEFGTLAEGYATFTGASTFNDANGDTGATTLSVNASLQFTRGAGSFITDGFKSGMIIITTGFTNGGNNATKTISSVAAQTIIVTDTTGLIQEGGGGDERMKGGNRWGLLQAIDGGYLQQGLFLMGTATYAVDFRDANTSILIANTKKVISTFNSFEIRNTSSQVDWTSVSVLALGTTSRGDFTVTDNATVNLISCVFTDTGLFNFLPATTVTNCIFRRTDKITTGGATFTGCTIDSNRATSAMLTSSPAAAALISNTSFISNGTGHAIEIGGSPDNMTLTNVDFSLYAESDGDTGDEAVYINIDNGSMNLTISGGSIPSIKTAGCVVTVISNAVTTTVITKDIDGIVIENVRVLVLAAAGGPMPSNVTVSEITNSGTTATVTHTTHGMATNDKVQIKGASHLANNGVFTITKINNDSYSYTMGSSPGSNPIGIIKATYVALSGLTNGSGLITMSRVFSFDQPITGRARKSTGDPLLTDLYKTSTILGTIDSVDGSSTTVLMITDE